MTPRGRDAVALVLVLLLALGIRAQVHASGKVLLGRPTLDAAFQLPLATDFALALPAPDGNSKQTWWCSVCAAASRDTRQALVEPPRMLLGSAKVTTLALLQSNKTPPVVMATKDLVLVVAIPQTLVKDLPRTELAWARAWALTPRGDLDAHGSAHLWLWRMLQQQAQFEALLGFADVLPKGALPTPQTRFGHPQRGEVYVFSDIEAYRVFGRHHFGSSGTRNSWWFHQAAATCVTSQCMSAETPAQDAARFDHALSHQFFFMYRQFFYHLPAWVTEGLGHWFERRHKLHGETFCLLGEVQGWKTDIGNDWWQVFKERVQLGEDQAIIPFSQLIKLHELPPALHPQAWALTAYLIGLGPQKYRVFLDILKSKRADESMPELMYRAVETAYACDLVSLQENFRAWVKTLRGKP
ncbi:MAG: hypothetical protein EXS14_05010 [Planctomycetes bacterium]|nr:hypothetical protein [Planctomycetota bacterium]